MKEAFWVFRSFGLVAGVLFVWHSLLRRLRKIRDFVLRRKPKRHQMFEELSDKEARNVAWAFGIYRWTDRKDLNRQWNEFEKRLNTLH